MGNSTTTEKKIRVVLSNPDDDHKVTLTLMTESKYNQCEELAKAQGFLSYKHMIARNRGFGDNIEYMDRFDYLACYVSNMVKTYYYCIDEFFRKNNINLTHTFRNKNYFDDKNIDEYTCNYIVRCRYIIAQNWNSIIRSTITHNDDKLLIEYTENIIEYFQLLNTDLKAFISQKINDYEHHKTYDKG